MPFFYLTCLVAALDQWLKMIVQTRLTPFQDLRLLNGLLSITYVKNPGAAFSLFQSQTLLLILISMGVFIVVWFNRRQLATSPRILQIGLAIALGGALGNFIDRIRLGYVVDFVDLHFWPVFNVADAGIFVGVGLTILGLLRYKTMEHTKSEQNSVESANFATQPDSKEEGL